MKNWERILTIVIFVYFAIALYGSNKIIETQQELIIQQESNLETQDELILSMMGLLIERREQELKKK